MITLHRRALIAAALLPTAARAAAPVDVVASFSILADFARTVGGEAATAISLVPPDGDPHSFQPRPSDLGRLKRARLIVENGLGLEGWLSRLVQSSGFAGQTVLASQGIPPRHMTEDGRNVPDPHIWQDPRRAVRMVQNVAAGLAAADPANAGAYAERANTLKSAILTADTEIGAEIAPIPAARRQIITTHDAFGYYGARYGIAFTAPLGISTEGEPSPRGLARLAEQIRRSGIRTIFLENMTNPTIAQSLAREAGVTVGPKLYSDSLSPPGGPAATYLDMLRYNTAQFLVAMRAPAG